MTRIGIGSVGNGNRDGDPQFLIRFGIIDDDVRGDLVIRDGDNLVIKSLDPGTAGADRQDIPVIVFDLDPVADLEGFVHRR